MFTKPPRRLAPSLKVSTGHFLNARSGFMVARDTQSGITEAVPYILLRFAENYLLLKNRYETQPHYFYPILYYWYFDI